MKLTFADIPQNLLSQSPLPSGLTCCGSAERTILRFFHSAKCLVTVSRDVPITWPISSCVSFNVHERQPPSPGYFSYSSPATTLPTSRCWNATELASESRDKQSSTCRSVVEPLVNRLAFAVPQESRRTRAAPATRR